MNQFQEVIKKRVGGTLSLVPVLQRNARMLRGVWLPSQNDGTLVRKTVGPARK
jgi:hypothetical protein